MTKNYDQEFGPNGIYGWPACLDIAERLLEAAPYAESSADCLNDDFFSEYLDYLDKHLFEDYPEEEAYELAEAARKSRQELFKDATKWPLPYLVASAIYKILSTEAERIHIIDNLWRDLFWPFLSFDEPVFDMLQAKGWGKIYRKEIREGFKLQLRFEIRGLTGNRVMWGSDKDKPWLTREGFASHIYPEDLLRCLHLVGIDPGRAHSAVDKVFKLHSFTPLYRVLSYNPSSTCATVVRHKHRDEEGRGEEGKGEKGETKSLKKPLAGLRIDVLKFIFGALIVAGGVIASNRLRLSRSNWASTRPVPCFATSSMGWGCLPIPKTRKQSAPRESSSSRSQQQPPEAITSASQESRPKRTGLFKERLSFQGTGLFKGKLSLQRNRAFITQQRWTPWEELQELQRKQSLRSHQLIDQSSVGSSDEPAEQLQPLRTEASVVQRVWRTLSDKLADKYNIVSGRKKGWIDNGRILTEGSPEIKAWRDLLAENGETLPSITQVCVHLQRRTTMLGTEVTFTK